MNISEVISKTRKKDALSSDEISWLVDSYVNGEIPDYQMSAWLMAVCINGLTDDETSELTIAMRDSGDVLDLSGINGVTVDKHSTGGIGDKTSLIIAPVCAACGIYVPKMSGRGLGFTGGTIDKLESIPGFNVEMGFEDYIKAVNSTGAAIISQTGRLVPADKKMYALRDVTGTVDSIPLICSSIMSKKLATGCDCILLDVKCGSGAFMKNKEDALKLARLMTSVGKAAGKRCQAVITDMNEPLGDAVGNALEVMEAAEILKGRKNGRLYQLCMGLSANMLELAGIGSYDRCMELAENAVSSGKALEILEKMIYNQGGNGKAIYDYSLLPQGIYKHEVTAEESGYISGINSEIIGIAALMTGAGRENKESRIDHSAGIVFSRHTGDHVSRGDVIMTLYSSSVRDFTESAKKALSAVSYSSEKPKMQPVIAGKYI